MKLFLSLLLLSLTFSMYAQNVGINKPNPTEKLDVNGNINISGTIKANGTAGTNGQILMSTGAGLSWGSAMGYKKCVQFYSPGNYTWTVPAGVTEVMTELWGGGSGGTGAVGGASGGYGRTVQPVVPGTIIGFTVGSGSDYGQNLTSNGGNSQVYYPGFSIIAYGGGGVFSTNYYSYARSGVVINGSTDNAFFMHSNGGTPNAITFGLSKATTYVQIINYGSGGAPVGMLNNTPVHGDIVRIENEIVISRISSDNSLPSAGGSAGQTYGHSGGPGMVLFWFN